MKNLIILSFLICSFSLFAASGSIKFTAKTNGPGISVEGDVTNPKLALDFKNLNKTTVDFDIVDLTTGMEKRDNHLHEKVFAIKEKNVGFINFSLAKIDCPKSAGEVDCNVLGSLKIKDQKNDISFKAKVNFDKKTVAGKAEISLNTFKLNAPTFMGIKVEDLVEVSFDVKE
jgi:polyisoprenoid-binding protein YceI